MKKIFCFFVFFFHQFCCGMYYSQCQQDAFVHEHIFKGYKHGVFVDIGANDGVTLSNTYFFEKELDWTGLCIEPIPYIFAELKKNRKAFCIEGCIAKTTGEKPFIIAHPCHMLSGLLETFDSRHVDRIREEIACRGGSSESILVHCYTFNDLMKQNGIQHINFLSIDTEGSEYQILSSIDYGRFFIDVIVVENNYGDPKFIPFLTKKGFRFVRSLDQDMVFINKASVFAQGVA